MIYPSLYLVSKTFSKENSDLGWWRVAQYDGVFPLKAGSEDALSPNDYREIIKYIKQYRSSFDS
ncbi:MAG: hypothetical protein ACTSP9_15055 [Promethearchaeota archaeon]